MLLRHKQLIGRPVETKSGDKLGLVDGFNLETDSHLIYQYLVKPSGLSKIFSQELIINYQQVVSLSAEKMIVDDLVYKQLASVKNAAAKNPVPAEVMASHQL